MPFFSFSINEINTPFKKFNIASNNVYFSKNTELWKNLNKQNSSVVNFLKREKRFQTKNSGYINEVYLSAGYVPIDGTKFALNLTNNNNMKAGFDFVKNINGFDIKFDYENNLSRPNKNNSVNFILHKIY